MYVTVLHTATIHGTMGETSLAHICSDGLRSGIFPDLIQGVKILYLSHADREPGLAVAEEAVTVPVDQEIAIGYVAVVIDGHPHVSPRNGGISALEIDGDIVDHLLCAGSM